MAQLVMGLTSASSKWLRYYRGKMRNRLFKICRGKHIETPEIYPGTPDILQLLERGQCDMALKQWFEAQFGSSLNWHDFTFKWDVSAQEPLKLITPFEWDGQMLKDKTSGTKFCDPSAFTQQHHE